MCTRERDEFMGQENGGLMFEGDGHRTTMRRDFPRPRSQQQSTPLFCINAARWDDFPPYKLHTTTRSQHSDPQSQVQLSLQASRYSPGAAHMSNTTSPGCGARTWEATMEQMFCANHASGDRKLVLESSPAGVACPTL